MLPELSVSSAAISVRASCVVPGVVTEVRVNVMAAPSVCVPVNVTDRTWVFWENEADPDVKPPDVMTTAGDDPEKPPANVMISFAPEGTTSVG